MCEAICAPFAMSLKGWQSSKSSMYELKQYFDSSPDGKVFFLEECTVSYRAILLVVRLFCVTSLSCGYWWDFLPQRYNQVAAAKTAVVWLKGSFLYSVSNKLNWLNNRKHCIYVVLSLKSCRKWATFPHRIHRNKHHLTAKASTLSFFLVLNSWESLLHINGTDRAPNRWRRTSINPSIDFQLQ